jgi:integrase
MMKGTIRPYGDRYRVWWDIGSDPVTGQRRQRTKILPSEEAARDWLEQKQGELESGMSYDERRGDMKVAAFVETYLAARNDVEQSTLVSYRAHLHNHAVRLIGRRRLRDITPDLLSVMYGRMLDEGKSPALIKAVHRVLHGMFAHAVMWKYLSENPAVSAITPKQEKREFATWTPDQLTAFLRVAREHRWGVGYLLSAATGMRRAEVCGLRWENVDLDACTADVRTTRLEIQGKVVDKPSPKSKQGRRTIPLDTGVVQALRAEKVRQTEQRLAQGEAYKHSGYVVVNPNGEAIRPNAYSQAFKRLARQAQVPEVRLHDVRHTWGTLAVAAGIDPKTVSQLLGHATVAFTLDIYSHGNDDARRSAAEVMGRLISG